MSRVPSGHVLAAIVLASLPVWWLLLAWWAGGVSGYLAVPGVGTSAFGWLALMVVASVVVLIGLARRAPDAFLAVFVVVAGALAIPTLVLGMADGISGLGVVIGALSVAQVVLLNVAIWRR